ncbi:MAG TPA: UPF0147 family protein [Methanocorpusculum sp.]|nr:UPF0147 family protein [Methanocorpusculum sp.]
MTSSEILISQALEMIQSISEDNSIPRNIRSTVDAVKNILINENLSISRRTANAISKIDDISNNNNMSPHVRTKIWQLISILEAIPLE